MEPFEAATSYFGAWLQSKLDEGLTRKDIAQKINVQASTVGRLIGGSRVNPYLDTVLRTAHAFQVEPSELMPSLEDLNKMVAASASARTDEV